MSVTSLLILKKIYELFVGGNETVRIKRVSVDQGSTVMLSSSTLQLSVNQEISTRGQQLNTEPPDLPIVRGTSGIRLMDALKKASAETSRKKHGKL